MSLWKKLKNNVRGNPPAQKPARPRPSPSSFPLHEVLIEGKLQLHIYAHEIAPKGASFMCWSFLTEGYWAHQHREILLTLQIPQGIGPNQYPRIYSKVFIEFYELISRGQKADTWSFSSFVVKMLGYQGFTYIPVDPQVGIELKSPTMAAIPLYPVEMEAMNTLGPARVLAQLGRLEQYYPIPFWTDLDRKPLPLEFMAESILIDMPSALLTEASFTFSKEHLTIRLKPSAVKAFQQIFTMLPENQVLILLTSIDPSADSCFVWGPGQDKPHAISLGSTTQATTGCYLGFVPEQAHFELKAVEDGMMCLLPTPAWTELRNALLSQENVSIPQQGEHFPGLRIEWLSQETPQTSPVT